MITSRHTYDTSAHSHASRRAVAECRLAHVDYLMDHVDYRFARSGCSPAPAQCLANNLDRREDIAFDQLRADAVRCLELRLPHRIRPRVLRVESPWHIVPSLAAVPSPRVHARPTA